MLINLDKFGKQWVVAPKMPEDFKEKFPEIHPIALQLLWNRGITTQKAIDEFLNPDWGEDIHDPFLFRDMAKAVDRIFQAIDKKEKIIIFGDYDADGVCGTAILKTTLDSLGADADIYLPDREKEGYGLSDQAIDFFKKANARLIITCDCGISNKDEISQIRDFGIEVIITDHHRIPKELPPAFAVIHPQIKEGDYPFPYLSGGAVAFKVAQALLRSPLAEKCFSAEGGLASPASPSACRGRAGWEKWLIDLVAISTVADVVELKGENRTLLKYGLIVLNKTRRLGLLKLFSQAGIKLGKITSSTIAWQISPRINAAGRVNHANVAFNLLSATDDVEATRLALELNQANNQRQKLTDLALKGAIEQIGKLKEEKLIYILHDPKWNTGVIGLAASRLVEKYTVPVILATNNEEGKIVASARSLDQLNIIETLEQVSDFLMRFGGHPRAAGFSVESVEAWNKFKDKFEKIVSEKISGLDLRPKISIDAEISLSEIDWDLWNNIERLAPFGQSNREPVFLLKNLEVAEISCVGSGNQHLRLKIKAKNGNLVKLIGFSFANEDRVGVDWCAKLETGSFIDVVIELGVNEWNGNRELQMKIIDLRIATN